MLILKDGTACVAMEVNGLDISTVEHSFTNEVAQAVGAALDVLPPNAYLQAIFQSGYSYEHLLEAFGRQQHADAHPLLKEARQARVRKYLDDDFLSRPRITYWLGIRQALRVTEKLPWLDRVVLTAFSSASAIVQKPLTAEGVQEVGNALARVRASFVAQLERVGLHTRLLSESDMALEIHEALNPAKARYLSPPVLAESVMEALGSPSDQVLFRGPNLSSQLALGHLKVQSDSFTLDDPAVVHRVFAVASYPTTSVVDWLHPVMYAYQPESPFRLVVTHRATDRELQAHQLEAKRRSILNFIQRQHADHAGEKAYADVDAFLKRLTTGDARGYETSMAAVITAPYQGSPEATLQHLRDADESLRAGFAASGTTMAVRLDEQLNGWLWSLPGAGYQDQNRKALITSNAQCLVPFWVPHQGHDVADMVFETRQRSLVQMSVRQSKGRADTGMLLIGRTGAGKSFLFLHLALYSFLDQGGHIIATDTKGPRDSSFKPCAEVLGGTYLCMSAMSTGFNICPPRQDVFGPGLDEPYKYEETRFLQAALCLMTVPGFDDSPEKLFYQRIADDIIEQTYARKRTDKDPIRVSHVLETLQTYEPSTEVFQPLARSMALRLRLWCEHPTRSRLVDSPVSVDTSSRFIVFDFYGLGDDEELSAVLIAYLSDRIKYKIRTLPRQTPKFFPSDEAWRLYSYSPTTMAFLDELFRTARSGGATPCMITQHHSDIRNTPAGAAIWQNSAYFFLFRYTDKDAIAEIADIMGLSPRAERLFASLEKRDGQFSEFLFVDRHATDETRAATIVRYAPTPFDYWLSTSDPRDVAERTERMQRSGRSLVDVVKELADEKPYGL
jgi:hypothetical protein